MPGLDEPLGPAPSALPDGGTGTMLDERPETQDAEPGDHERFSHYVRKEKILESAVTGTAVIALCGKVWVPSRDPQRFPVCPECKEIYESLPSGGGDNSGSGGGSGGGDRS
jgi:hypothetical protein